MACLVCGGARDSLPSWTAICLPDRGELCSVCLQKLDELRPPWCLECSRPLQETGRCADCLRWGRSTHWAGLLERNLSLFSYHSFLRELLSTFKYRGDTALANIFTRSMQRAYRRYFPGAILVPIPLSRERLSERGFNQAKVLAELIPTKTMPILIRTVHEDKQSKRTRRDRLRGSLRPFSLAGPIPLKNRHIVLIDDIYTTGSTVRKAALPLLENGAASVSSLTIARS